jgi:predicted  nucleic acid-binding Zn-ribbon protein
MKQYVNNLFFESTKSEWDMNVDIEDLGNKYLYKNIDREKFVCLSPRNLFIKSTKMRENAYFYKLKCETPQCKTQFRFQCKCHASELLLSGCENCKEKNFKYLERWNKNQGRLISKTWLSNQAIFRILNDARPQSRNNVRRSSNEQLIPDDDDLPPKAPKQSREVCSCVCSCSCKCVWTDPI